MVNVTSFVTSLVKSQNGSKFCRKNQLNENWLGCSFKCTIFLNQSRFYIHNFEFSELHFHFSWVVDSEYVGNQLVKQLLLKQSDTYIHNVDTVTVCIKKFDVKKKKKKYVQLSICPSAMFWSFFNIMKRQWWNFIRLCEHVEIHKMNIYMRTIWERGQLR